MKAWRVVVVLACVAFLAAADEAWKKEPKSWSKEEASEILNESPWGKRIPTAETYVSDSSENKQTGGKRVASETERGALRPTDFATVVWWSARTPRRAYLRMFELSGQEVSSEQAKQFAETQMPNYIVVIWGGGQQVNMAAKLSEEDLLKSGWLETSRHKKLMPLKVEVVKNAQGRPDRVQFEFPREVDGQPTVAAGDKKLNFKWKLPKTPKETVDKAKQFEAAFQPNKMSALGEADI